MRRIDWNVTARTGVPHVRVHLAERVLVTWLFWTRRLRCSSAPPTGERRTSPRASRLRSAMWRRGAATGWGSRRSGTTTPRTLPPRQGRFGLLGLLSALRDSAADGNAGASSLGDALHRTAALARQRSAVIVVSDFRGPLDWRRPLLELAGRHDVVAVEIRDPREQELPNAGVLWLVDPETGRQLRADTGNERLRARFAAAAAAERAERGPCACIRRCAPGGADDRRRLAPSVRGLSASRSTPVSFESPLALIALVVVPVLVGLYVVRERRRQAYAARFTTPGLLPNLVDATPAGADICRLRSSSSRWPR